ncbi:MAG: hypothetical protein U0414_27745 [Polyangiaceae bacterium]
MNGRLVLRALVLLAFAAGCSSSGGGEGGAGAFDAPYPDPRCDQVAADVVGPSLEELHHLATGRWLNCENGESPGIELTDDGRYYVLKQVAVGRFERDFSVEQGTWEITESPSLIVSFERANPPSSTGTGGTFFSPYSPSFTTTPRRMKLQGMGSSPTYVRVE